VCSPFALHPVMLRECRKDETLPGVASGAASLKRKAHPELRCKALQFSPGGRQFAVATTEGLVQYSLDDTLVFDPFELGEVGGVA